MNRRIILVIPVATVSVAGIFSEMQTLDASEKWKCIENPSELHSALANPDDISLFVVAIPDNVTEVKKIAGENGINMYDAWITITAGCEINSALCQNKWLLTDPRTCASNLNDAFYRKYRLGEPCAV